MKDRYDISSLKMIIHGAAPCPPEVKQAMIDWVGPILFEYYAGSEGGAGFTIRADEWLKKPGSVGKRPQLLRVKIMDEEGNELPPGTPGLIYHETQKLNPFQYYKDTKKTQSAHRGEFFTLGDIGYFDEDDYLFLTGRSAEIIISGGVNIYPQEVDNELIKHPAVEDACTIGVPNKEWGEEVKSVIMLRARLRAERRAQEGDHRVRAAAPRGLQGAALDRFRRRTAAQRRRQDQARRGAQALLGRAQGADLGPAYQFGVLEYDFVRIVTSSSAADGCSAMVESNCALVAPIFRQMPTTWTISAA